MKTAIAILVTLIIGLTFAQDIPKDLNQLLINVVSSADGLVVPCDPEYLAMASHTGARAQKTLCAQLPDFYTYESATVLRSSVDLEFLGTDWFILAPWSMPEEGFVSKAFALDGIELETIEVYVFIPEKQMVVSAAIRE